MTEQFRIIDINRWWRTGGTDYEELKASCDSVIIQACAGTTVNEILEEQVDGCKSVGLDYETYVVPAANIPAEDTVDFYLSLPGVMEAPKWLDAEPTGGAMASAGKMLDIMEIVDSRSPGRMGYYSNYKYTNKLGNPLFIQDRDVWWAEYPLHWQVYRWVYYRYFEKFLADKPWWHPKWAVKLGIKPILHQFTKKGDAQMYGANATTDHPTYKVGIKSADLNVGLIALDEYRARRFAPYGDPPPPPPEDVIDYILATLADHEDRIGVLENGDDPVVPPPVPSDVVWAVVTKDPHTVAWAVTEWKQSGVPIIETNAYHVTKDPNLKFPIDKRIQVRFKAITSDGNQKWYELYGVDTHFYPKLYVRKSDVMKLV